jgi:O-antigen/teichoic acid export membrane protein
MKVVEKYNKMPIQVRASLWFIICNILQKGIAFITTPIFTRLMSTSQYGQVTLYYSWLEIFTIFATLNLFYGVYNNALTAHFEDRNQVTSSMLGLCNTITIAAFIIYIVFHTAINQLTRMSTVITLLLFAEVLFIPAFRFWAALQRFEYKYRALVVISLAISVLVPLIGVPAVMATSEKGIARIVTGVLPQLAVSVFLLIIIYSKGKKFYDKQYWAYALAFNLPLIPHYLSSTILNQSDRIMIDSMCGTDKAGIYGLAYTIGALVIIVNEAIMASYTPYTYQHLKQKDYKPLRKNTTYLLLVVMIITLCLVFVAPEIMFILGGEKYAEGAWIIAPIAASTFFRFLYSLYANIEFYYEENKFIMIASVVTALLNIVLNYIGIRLFGYLAAGYTTLICFAIYAFSHWVFSRRVLKKHVQMKELYNDRLILLLSLVTIVISLGAMITYDFAVIRFLFIAAIIILCIVKRNRILDFAKTIKGS